MAFLFIIGVLLVMLKLAGVIAWAWYVLLIPFIPSLLVLMPTLAGMGLAIIGILIAVFKPGKLRF